MLGSMRRHELPNTRVAKAGHKRDSWVSRDLPGSYFLTDTCLMTMDSVADARLSRITELQWN